jgi:monoamine oxidase
MEITMKQKLTRRDFLKVASIGAASAFALSCEMLTPNEESETMNQNSTNHTEILVIGAGIAGLAAARALTEGDWDVIILEARNRIGGRMWTDTSLGVPLDLGASWIHGIKGNPITKLANQFGAKTIATDEDNGIVFKADGSEMPDREYEAIETLFEEIYEEVAEMQEDTNTDMTLQQAFDRVLKSRSLSNADLQKLNHYIHAVFALELGADPQDISLWEWDQDEEFSGDEVIFPEGYRQITDGLARGLDIRLGVVVKSIRYGAGGVEVETSDGMYRAEKAVVTIPLGVLKQKSVKFEPPLPAWKQSAVDRLAMGVLNKVYMKFPAVFWGKRAETFVYFGEHVGEWSDWLSFVPYTNEPVIMAFHGGAKGRALEKLTDEQIVAGAMKTLRAMFGSDIPNPSGYLITRWGSDPFSVGSYSYIPPFASGKDYDALFKPVDDVLFFAGEATSREYPSTVHGAYLSGIAAAEEID